MLYNKLPKHNLLLLGDINLPNIDWLVPKPLTGDKFTNVFIGCVLRNCFEQIVKVSMRGLNILDIVLCINLHILSDAHIIPPVVNSNHEANGFI